MRAILVASSALAALVAANTVKAADAASARTGVGEVVVTARRVAEDQQKVPVAVTVVDSQALLSRNIRTLNDLQTALPGVQLADSPDNVAGTVISIRGQNTPDDAITTDPNTGIYYDGVYLPRVNGLKFILQGSDEIGQVEVLRGPQGTLFGRNTTGGAFNITSAAPGADFTAYARGIVGNYSLWDVSLGANLPLAPEAALRLGFEHGQHDGYGKDAVGAGLQSEDYDSFHGRFSAKAGDRFSLDAVANYIAFTQGESVVKLHDFNPASLQNPDTAQTAGAVIADVLVESGLAPIPQNFPTGIGIFESFIGASPYRTGGTDDASPNRGHLFTGGLTLAYKLSDLLTLKSITGVVTTARSGRLDLDATPFAILPVQEYTQSTAWSEEAQALFRIGPVDGVAGAYFSRETGEDDTLASELSVLGAPPFTYDGVADNRSEAVFAQANWRVTDRLTVTGGLRYTWDSKGLRSFNHAGGGFARRFVVPTDPNPVGAGGFPNPDYGLSTDPAYVCLIAPNLQNVAPGLCEAHFVNDYSALTWLGSASYQFSDQIMGYLKVSRGYRGGGENLRGGALTFAPYGPEFVTQYETGIKTTFLNARARLNAAAFYTDYTGIQLTNIITIQEPNGQALSGTTIDNAGAAHLEGLEVEAAAIPIQHLTLGVTADWFHGKYTRYTYAGVDETTQPWQAPDYDIDLLARIEIPLAVGDLALQADYYFQGRSPLSLGDITACIQTGSGCRYDASQVLWSHTEQLLSARITLHVQAWNTDFSLWGRNLTDQHYIVSVLGPIDSRVYNVAYYGDPLTFGLEVRKAF
jgi:iron complex outermembrane receptor protein